ncbi:mitochondrial dicarboxylate/tricarboxylate transporter DTC [Coffea arabica]|uniref:Mitochondrial dicarboxylate/tricarboxylate transporter DTC n=1 Tax=Coffea arabica TaxID=13443 RepID=A0A6P6SXH3_COFAR|nr:mitochondrial dicarboxylate/tricarboxylate transporter DTC-like [Coffea arabica]
MDDSEGFTVEEKKTPNSIEVSSYGVYHRNKKIWPTLKPFVNGFLAGQLTLLGCYGAYWSAKLTLYVAEEAHDHRNAAKIRTALHAVRKNLPHWKLFQATYATAQFGSFDILTKKVEAANGGLRLTLYQEACCGLISGGIAGSFYYPFASLRASSSQSAETQINYRNLFASLSHKTRSEGLFALWKGSGFYVSRQMVMNMGLLTSYSRSVGYFSESVGLTKFQAQLGAGIVSAFFAAACGCPWPHIAAIKRMIQADGGRKHSHRDALYCIWQVFRPGGQFKIYSEIFKSFLRFTPYYVMQWLNLEDVRALVEEKGL